MAALFRLAPRRSRPRYEVDHAKLQLDIPRVLAVQARLRPWARNQVSYGQGDPYLPGRWQKIAT